MARRRRRRAKRARAAPRRRAPARRTKPMARRGRRVKRAARRAYGARGGMQPIIDGAIAGVAAEAGQKFIGPYGAPLGIGAVGYFMNNATLKTIAGLQAGSMIGDQLPMIGGGGSAVKGGLLFGD